MKLSISSILVDKNTLEKYEIVAFEKNDLFDCNIYQLQNILTKKTVVRSEEEIKLDFI